MSGSGPDLTDRECEPLIRVATDAEDYNTFGQLCRDYVAWCQAQYEDMPWFFEQVFAHQSLEDELSAYPAKFGPPKGRALIATAQGVAVACAAFHRVSDTDCELKRLFVTRGARRLGLGRRLSESVFASAAAEGYSTIKLDTADRLTGAIRLYETMGFRKVAPYRQYPKRLMQHLVFMESAI